MRKIIVFVAFLSLTLLMIPMHGAYAKKDKTDKAEIPQKESRWDESSGDVADSEALDTADENREKDLRTSIGENDSEAYDETSEKFWGEKSLDNLFGEAGDKASKAGKDLGVTLETGFLRIYDILGTIYPVVLLGSFGIGFLVANLSTKNKKIKKRAINLGCIAIPVIMTLLVYVLPYLYIRLT